ncbi:peroxiredoxin-6-like [Anoplophora glabripennis]|uniref:peroxiredoxin-6-like n=1 Tax=Anoplophora glabripennis TaxID=217634 RepID=UPI0008752561|nr:peroxiredoxin-6-like [Anoplophora glabripennis]
MPTLRLGDTVPNFSAETTKGNINFYEWQEDKWVILFSHPKDFTPVCTSELSKIAVYEPYFSKRNVKFLAHSCDSLKEHLAWVKDIISYCRHLPSNDLHFPIIADENGELATLLDLFDRFTDENNKLLTSRPLYIIDPQHKLRFMLRYPVTTGRNPKEILRVLESMQICDRIPQVETPMDWMLGNKVLVKSEVKESEIRRIFPNGTQTEFVTCRGAIRSVEDYELF